MVNSNGFPIHWQGDECTEHPKFTEKVVSLGMQKKHEAPGHHKMGQVPN
jgi:hypothetical protein